MKQEMKQEKIYKKYCIGCGLCAALKGERMREDERGYLGFEQEPASETLAFCAEVCPVGDRCVERLNETKIWGTDRGRFWGYAADPRIRKRASSGGVLTALSLYLLENAKVDGIIQIREDEKNPVGTVTCISRTRKEVLRGSGSRYAVSHPLLDMWEMISPQERYCFIGKPCDTAALKNLLEKEEALKEKFPYILTFFCAGLPGRQANERLLQYMGCPPGRCRTLSYRGNGWPGFTRAEDENGEIFSADYNTSWGRFLGRDIHPFCRFCMDGTGERSDISCGDGWYLDDGGQPDFTEKEGRNIVFARTDEGKALLQEAASRGYIVLEPAGDETYLKKIQRYQYTRKATMYTKVLACRIFRHTVPYGNLRGLKKYAGFASPKEHFKILKGTVKRLLLGKM